MNGFEIGHKKSKGRPKGSINKRTINFLTVLEDAAFCPATALLEIYEEAMHVYREKNPAEPDRFLKIALDAAKDIASYSFPKLKAIELEKNDPLKNMSPEQKLEAMKHAVAALELEVGRAK